MPSQPASSEATGFEAYVSTLAGRAPRIVPQRLHLDFDTWEAVFQHVDTTGPLEIELPARGTTNLELMRLLDVLRKQNLDIVNLTGHVAICTRTQAVELRSRIQPPRVGQVRSYPTPAR